MEIKYKTVILKRENVIAVIEYKTNGKGYISSKGYHNLFDEVVRIEPEEKQYAFEQGEEYDPPYYAIQYIPGGGASQSTLEYCGIDKLARLLDNIDHDEIMINE